MNRKRRTGAHARRGSALVPTLVVLTSLAIFGLAMVMSTMSGARTINHQADEYRLSSAVESVAILAMEQVWSSYLEENGGAAGNIGTIDDFLDEQFGQDAFEEEAPWDAEAGTWTTSPAVDAGFDLLSMVELPVNKSLPELNDVRIDAMQLVRRDVPGEDAIQLWITVSASTNRGQGVVYPALNRALQQVWTIEPEDFDGFDFALLANNVNCIFCHTQVDNVERYYNGDPDQYGEFDRVKVGTLETLMLRSNMDSQFGVVNDFDADSVVAGTVYVRGAATDHGGTVISDWTYQTFHSYEFDSAGNIVQDPSTGEMNLQDFSPAGTPAQALENLYLDYSADYADMVDGNLPTEFPPPFPDDGGIDPLTGQPPTDWASLEDNKIVDDAEFYALTEKASGAITAGIITVKDHGDVVDEVSEYAAALFWGNQSSIQQTVDGNVILSGTEANPITIDGMVAIDGDLIINGYVKGSGSLYVKGNVYVPTDLQYLNGQEYLDGDTPGYPSGPETFGLAQDGTPNAMAIAAGGNILVGDYMRPSAIIPGQPYNVPAKYDYIAGDASDEWNFSVAEISLFNRTEWSKTQPTLPDDPGEATADPATWTLVNPLYEGPDYIPRYYSFGPGDEVPIYNKGNLWFDAATETWHGDEEVPLQWDSDLLTYAYPNDPDDPILYPGGGQPNAVLKTLSPSDGWITDYMYKLSIEYFEDVRPYWTPMRIDGLLYTNNAIFTLVHRVSPQVGQMVVNGSLVAADLGMLAPGYPNSGGTGTDANVPNSPFAVGLRLNYDAAVKSYLDIENPLQVQLKRTLWNPTANLL